MLALTLSPKVRIFYPSWFYPVKLWPLKELNNFQEGWKV